MEKFKVYKHETVTSVAEIEAADEQQAIRIARATEGSPQAPQYTESERRNARLSLSAEPRAGKTKEGTADGE